MNEEKIKLKKEQGERLKKIVAYFGYDYKKIGEYCDLKASQIKDRANGVVEIKLYLASKLEKELKINGDWLLTGQGEMIKKGEEKTVPMEDHMLLLKDHVACLKELKAAYNKIERLEAPPTGAEDDAG